MACLSAEQIERFVAGSGEVETQVVQAHVDSCESCRGGIAAVVKAGRRAKSLGRYIVIDELGAGGMGVVYRAFDPELGRNVAVKLLHAAHLGETSEAHARLAREARALAALSHPNVVTIYDIGSEGDEVFIAMELVDGMTLRRWLASEKRTPEQIATVLAQAGRGLAAAHAAGLVHRDFKPENVLVRSDGRAQVSDFGLARSSDDSDDSPIAAQSTANTTGLVLTRSGAVLGTLPYMSPEQVSGDDTDARSDQFSYASVIIEALTGERPFRSGSLAERRAAFERDDSPAGLRKLVGRLRPLVARALAIDPLQRLPSIEPLFAALESRGRSRTWIAVAALAAAASGAAVYVGTREHVSCANAGSRLSTVWNPQRAASIGALFAHSPKKFAADAWASTQKGLDAYATDWSTAAIGACEDTHVHKSQSEALLDLRVACLDQRLAAIDAFATVLEHPEGSVIENAPKAVQQLPQLAACADRAALSQVVPPPSDPVTRGRVIAIRTRIAEATALRASGQLGPAVAMADAIATEALAIGYAPVSAEALLLRGSLENDRHAPTTEATLSRAADLAEAGRADETKAQAWMQLVKAATAQAHYPEAHVHAQHANAVLERLGPGHEALVARLANYEGGAYMEQGDYAHARELQEKALAIRDKLYNHDGAEVATVLNSLGNVEHNLSHDQAAFAAHTRALEIRTRVLGPHHPDTAASDSNLSAVLSTLGRLDEALEHLEKARAIDIEVFGPESKQTMQIVGNTANLYKEMGRYIEAAKLAQEALRIAILTVGPKHPLTATQHYLLGEIYLEQDEVAKAKPEIEACIEIRHSLFTPNHAEVLVAERLLGRYELQAHHLPQSRKILEDVLARQIASLGADYSDVSGTRGILANTLDQIGDHKAALVQFEASLAIDEKNVGTEHGDDVVDLVGIGNEKLALRDYKGAAEALERAVLLANKLTDVEPGVRADAVFALGRAIWAGNGDRKRAKQLVTEAESLFANLGKIKALDDQAAKEWLARK